jgi:hypothetical protein
MFPNADQKKPCTKTSCNGTMTWNPRFRSFGPNGGPPYRPAWIAISVGKTTTYPALVKETLKIGVEINDNKSSISAQPTAFTSTLEGRSEALLPSILNDM